MRVLVGLGNPGKRYERTPHNFGFEVIDRLAARWSVRLKRAADISASIAESCGPGNDITLLKPLTYMNLSGTAVKALARKRSFTVKDFFVICDDVNLPVGRLRIRKSGSAGGHNGLQSVIDSLGTIHFPRLRIGIAPPDTDIEDLVTYVLSPVYKAYRPIVEEVLEHATNAVEICLGDDIERAMNKYNALNLYEAE